MLSILKSAKVNGMEAVPVTVECDVQKGIGIHLVGLQDAATKESLLRTVTAMQSKGYRIPGKKVIINLAPCDLRKEGASYDLPIAISLLAASEQEDIENANRFIIMGELALDGAVRSVPGTYQAAELAASMKGDIDGIILPMENAVSCADITGIKVFAVNSLNEAVTVIKVAGTKKEEQYLVKNTAYYKTAHDNGLHVDIPYPDFGSLHGCEGAKRVLEIAAAGGHHVLLMGNPSSGRALLAKAMTGILPPMTKQESDEVSRIYSIAGRNMVGSVQKRPYRMPHYSASMYAMLGGGTGEAIVPGEVSLAHAGVLCIDEFDDMPKSLKEALRGPVEDGQIVISRLKSKTTFPARFQLVACTKPCPCGQYGHGDRCTCTPGVRERFLNTALSGPVFDHIDIQAFVTGPTLITSEKTRTGTSEVIAKRVAAARKIQEERYKGTAIRCNNDLKSSDIGQFCPLSEECEAILETVMVRMNLSARAYSRIIRIARTIADLAGEEEIAPAHISEAMGYRFLDRRTF